MQGRHGGSWTLAGAGREGGGVLCMARHPPPDLCIRASFSCLQLLASV